MQFHTSFCSLGDILLAAGDSAVEESLIFSGIKDSRSVFSSLGSDMGRSIVRWLPLIPRQPQLVVVLRKINQPVRAVLLWFFLLMMRGREDPEFIKQGQKGSNCSRGIAALCDVRI